MPNLFETRMGKIFYEVTAPKIAKSLERIADQLESQNEEPISNITQDHWSELKEKLEKEVESYSDQTTEEALRYVLELMNQIEKEVK